MHDFRGFFVVGGLLREEIMLGGFHAKPIQHDWVYALHFKQRVKAQVHQCLVRVVTYVLLNLSGEAYLGVDFFGILEFIFIQLVEQLNELFFGLFGMG